jgi:hypothetical protein
MPSAPTFPHSFLQPSFPFCLLVSSLSAPKIIDCGPHVRLLQTTTQPSIHPTYQRNPTELVFARVSAHNELNKQSRTNTTMSTVRRVRDLGRVIDGRIRKGWPFVGSGGSHNSVHKTKGLDNPGLLCYRNAVLQCLLHTPEFYRYLVRQDRCPAPGDNCVFCALRGLAREYWSNGEDERQLRQQSPRVKRRQTESPTDRRYRALDNLNTAMNNHPAPYAFMEPGLTEGNNMDVSGQQDAHECFIGLFNMLKYENGRVPKSPNDIE